MKILYLLLACLLDTLAMLIAFFSGAGLMRGIIPVIVIILLLTAAIFSTTKAEMDVTVF